MAKLLKNDLWRDAEKLLKKGYKKLYATDDGHFFTDHELAKANAKKNGSEIFYFSSAEDLKTRAEKLSGEVQPVPIDPASAIAADPEPPVNPVPEPVQAEQQKNKFKPNTKKK